VFDRASNSQWILFFDEADALFGKRSDTKDARDRYANQEVAYLLQRIEDYAGVVILATNLKANIDEAFLRRFHSVIYFPAPGPEQRRRLWQSMFSPPVRTSPDIDWNQIAAKYEITGGAILNIVRYAALQAIQRGNPEIGTEDILAGIRREMRKEGKNIVS
jgi:SpoVK/Ycf46/Vps4 family AAA+-type ATPase